jgi:hypothetical protein
VSWLNEGAYVEVHPRIHLENLRERMREMHVVFERKKGEKGWMD